MDKVAIVNVHIHNVTKTYLLDNLRSGMLITPNVDHLVRLQKDKEFYDVYKEADWVICDSKIVGLGLNFLGSPVKEVIPGSSFFPEFCKYNRFNDEVKIFLLGAAPGVASLAMKRINERIGREIIVGTHSPSFGFESNSVECEQIIGLINQTDATVLVVGVGAPKQEKWISKYRDEFTRIKLFMALGATIDFEAGTTKRAPQIFQSLNLEWFHRMILNPRRLLKRYIVDDMPFFYYLVKQKLGFYKDPYLNE
ncbi:WecB/TagA/CpsF family glycosyltransferase [Spirosoma sp. RP8]|uniref:WecB/TagA/CpsF family glycosyltransferase n=1 Tax=Spirosoma liriopis TaxID=2937440 RepID=A0ABT0HNL7_9BACT|nr:WecB/TagA/CpsF family glycosyltransferase [Spirosoma liriopis]MCK8493761.1 WecB/TagA/CpsF family glycosyltransferase [Spirosoma liriopis]